MTPRTLVFGYDYLLSQLLFAGESAEAWERAGRRLDEILFMLALALWGAAAIAGIAPPATLGAWLALAAAFPLFPRAARLLAAPERIVGGYSPGAARWEPALTLALAALAGLACAFAARLAFAIEPRLVARPLAHGLATLLTGFPWALLAPAFFLGEPLWRRPLPPLRLRVERLIIFYLAAAPSWLILRLA